MTSSPFRASVALALGLIAATSQVAFADNANSFGDTRQATLPLVPVEQTSVSQAPASKPKKVSVPSEVDFDGTAAKYDRRRITVEPGVNTIVRVAEGHLNRIVTPFQHPQVRTTATNATTQVSDSVVYVAPASSAPVTLYLTEKGDEMTAVSLTLVPRRVPPRSFEVDVQGHIPRAVSAKAEHWERASDYQQAITNVMRTLALGQIPPGYSMSRGAKSEPPYCYQPGLKFEFMQSIQGHDFWVAVGRMSNVSAYRIEFEENACLYERRVAGVAAWPRIILQPGQQSEVYVVMRHVAETQDRAPERPSLIQADMTAAVPAAAPRQPLPASAPRARPVTVASAPAPAPVTAPEWKVMYPPFPTAKPAREKVAQLRAMGYPAETYADGSDLFVRIPGYTSREDANRAMAKLRQKGEARLTVSGGY